MTKNIIKRCLSFFVLTFLLMSSFLPLFASGQDGRTNKLELVIENLNDDTIAITALVPAFEFSCTDNNNEKYALLTLNGEGFSNIEGQAQLPKIRRMVEIPQGANPTIIINDVTWEETSLNELNMPALVFPLQPSIQKIGETIEFVIDDEYYTSDQFFPIDSVQILEISQIRERRFALVELSPVSYNPVTGQLKLMISCDVTMKLPGTDMVNTVNSIEQYSTSAHEELFAKIFQNYGYYEAYAQDNKEQEGYLIIVYDDFSDEIAPLAAWKTGMGYATTVTSTSEIPGGVTTATIKAYIEDAYDTWTIPPAYVLLIGDTPQIPTFTGSSCGTATDNNYGTMDADIFQDIFIGRFPASTGAHVVAMVDKTIYYEDGDFDTDVWIKNASLLASTDNYQISEGTHNYVVNTHLLPHNYSCDLLYTVTYDATTQDVRDSINAGASLVIYSGHGGDTSWADGPPFSQADVNGLTNENMYPFVCSHACVTGTFTVAECFGETWLRAANKGGLAFWGSSHNTYWTEDDIIERKTFDAWWNDSMLRIGQMTQKGLYDSYQYFGGGNMPIFVESYNILGDPSLIVWTENPFTPEHDIKVYDLIIPSVVAHGETQTVSALVKNVGNHSETNLVVNFLVDGTVIDSTRLASLDSLDSINSGQFFMESSYRYVSCRN